MVEKRKGFQAESRLSSKSTKVWRAVQITFWAAGVAEIFLLFFRPALGIHLFWNLLIPIAPVLLVVCTGLWRNICPLGTVSLLPYHLGFARGRRLNLGQQGRLHLCGVGLFFLLVPLRHVFMDTSGPGTGIVLITLAGIAFGMGWQYERKSGWCAGLCPVHPIEKMYGSRVGFQMANAHCRNCSNCSTPCPDSTPEMTPLNHNKRTADKLAGVLIVGGLPGFIWGWFHVPDFHEFSSAHLWEAYRTPFLGTLVSLTVFLWLYRFQSRHRILWFRLFAATAVACYYWYRLPALVGYGLFPGDGMLIDLSGTLPQPTIWLFQGLTTAFFFWWLLWRKPRPKNWGIRPPYLVR